MPSFGIYTFGEQQTLYDDGLGIECNTLHPQIPGSFHDFLTTLGLKPTQRSNVLTQCRHELMHQVWRILLNGEFLEAYRHGVVLRCADGVMRRVYPRIFTYSADYKEKWVQMNPLLFSFLMQSI
jgi:hypothetical protein